MAELGHTYTGKEFNELYPTAIFFKLIKPLEPVCWTHDMFTAFLSLFSNGCERKFGSHGFVYTDGLNIDTIPFNPQGSCSAGGLYFTDSANLTGFLETKHTHVAQVIIPDDARVYVEEHKCKADKILLKLQDAWTIDHWKSYVRPQCPGVCFPVSPPSPLPQLDKDTIARIFHIGYSN